MPGRVRPAVTFAHGPLIAALLVFAQVGGAARAADVATVTIGGKYALSIWHSHWCCSSIGRCGRCFISDRGARGLRIMRLDSVFSLTVTATNTD